MGKSNLDDCLTDVLKEIGDCGRYQIFIFTLLCLCTVLTTLPHTAFIFITENLEYRCKIQECDQLISTEFEPKWLKDAVPYKHDKPNNCERYQFINSTNGSECSVDQFDRGIIEYCDDFLYKNKKASILVDFNLHCDQNLWKLTLVGTINSFAQFIGIPTAGFLSDKYGRRTLLVIGCVGCGIFGILRAFSNSYILFIILEFLDALVLSSTYTCCFILGVELVGPEKRVIAGSIGGYAFAIGEVLAASIAWLVPSWRIILLIFYAPLFLFIFYFWLIPESIRWLMSQGRYEETQKILKKVAKVNKREISQTSLEKLSKPLKEEEKQPIVTVFKSRILVSRFISSCFCWITCAFLFYGLSINSIALTENSYLNFIFVSLIEIPAYILTCLVVDRIGRRWTQFGAFFISAVACFVFIFISREQYALSLSLYMLGKFGATAAFTTVYLISSEIFPTILRHSLMGLCSMFARIGSMVAPQVPLLNAIWPPLSLILFSGMATISGLLTLSFPETTKLKLPDTIEEAENIGKKIQIV